MGVNMIKINDVEIAQYNEETHECTLTHPTKTEIQFLLHEGRGKNFIAIGMDSIREKTRILAHCFEEDPAIVTITNAALYPVKNAGRSKDDARVLDSLGQEWYPAKGVETAKERTRFQQIIKGIAKEKKPMLGTVEIGGGNSLDVILPTFTPQQEEIREKIGQLIKFF